MRAYLRPKPCKRFNLENQGSKGFALYTLPLEAQYAPVYGIATADVNKDGKKDMLLTGGNTWTRIKYGRYSANHGVLLLGNGKGSFTYATHPQSGLNIHGNVRSLAPININNSNAFIAGINDTNAVLIKIK